MPYNRTKFQVETHQGVGRWAKSLENPENLEKLSPGRGGGYWGERPLGDMSTYLRQHERPKLLWQITLVIIYKPTRFQVEAHPGAGSVGKIVLKIPKSHEIMSDRGPGTSASKDWG